MNHDKNLARAIRYATTSPDPNTQNAALIYKDDKLVSADVNRFTDYMADFPARWEPEYKYTYVEHAERNAIYSAAKVGKMLLSTVMYAPFASCSDCARGIIQCGIKTLVRYPFEVPERWRESTRMGDLMLRESGIQIIELTPTVGVELRFNGQNLEL
jgi:dCMP deaminase